MNRLLIISTLIVLTSCGQSTQSDNSSNQIDLHRNTPTKSETTKTNQKSDTVEKITGFECTELDFSSEKERSDSLVAFMEKAKNSDSTERQIWERKFFCAFPNSFEGMQSVFGYDDDKAAAPLYSTDNPTHDYIDKRIFSDVIGFFSELKSIPDTVYYKKYIRININGNWEADNISGAFGFHYCLINDTENVCKALSAFSAQEIRSVFRFIFDGPHPKNEYNENIYKNLKPEIESQNKRLSRLLTQAYNNLMTEDDGHGH